MKVIQKSTEQLKKDIATAGEFMADIPTDRVMEIMVKGVSEAGADGRAIHHLLKAIEARHIAGDGGVLNAAVPLNVMRGEMASALDEIRAALACMDRMGFGA